MPAKKPKPGRSPEPPLIAPPSVRAMLDDEAAAEALAARAEAKRARRKKPAVPAKPEQYPDAFMDAIRKSLATPKPKGGAKPDHPAK